VNAKLEAPEGILGTRYFGFRAVHLTGEAFDHLRDGLQCDLPILLHLLVLFVSKRHTNRRSSASNPCPRAVRKSASRRSPLTP
jgi:hypothetical protein